MSAIGRLIINHWTVHKKLKDEKQEERERWLCLYLPIIPFQRWILFASAFMIQFCCGSLYSWSVFNAPIDTLIYNDATANKSVITFYIAVAMFGCTAMVMGPWLERNGPRRGIILGATMFLIGKSIAAISLHKSSIVGVYIGYGVFCGYGLGLNYICPVSALQKWFPDYRGLASGFAVGGFGAGSVVWSKAYLPMVDAVGLPGTFAIMGSMLFVIELVCAIALRTPPNGFDVNNYIKKEGKEEEGKAGEAKDIEAAKDVDAAEPTKVEGVELENKDAAAVDIPSSSTPAAQISKTQSRSYTLIEAITSPDFFFLYCTFFANEVFGLVALSRLSNMCVELFGRTKSEGADVVAINGVFNCLGRLFLPMFSDLAIYFFGNRFNPSTPRKVIFFVSLSVQLVIVSLLPSLIEDQNYGGFRAAMWILTACYGGGFGTIPAFLTNMFGAYNIGALHGIILTAWSIGGVGGGIGFTENYNHYKKTDIREAYEYNFKWLLAVICAGFVVLFLVRTDSKDRATKGYRFSVFGHKLFHFGKKD